MRAFILALLCAAALCGTPSLRAAVADSSSLSRDHLRPIAGGKQHAWFTLPTGAASGSSACTLYHMPAEAEPGAARLVRQLPQSPVDIAVLEDSALLVYASQPGRPRPVRQITATRLRSRWYIYSEPVPVAPLPGENSFLGFIGHETGPIALLKTDDTDRPRLLRLVRGEWQPLAAPFALESAHVWTLVSLGPAIAIAEQSPQSPPAILWVGVPDPDGAVVWERRALTLGPRDELLGADAQWISRACSKEGTLSVQLHRAAAPITIAQFHDIPSSAIAVPIGDRLTFAWEPATPSLRLMTRAITLSGRILHDDYAPLNNPVSAGEIQVLGAVLSSLVLTVLIFLLKPDRGTSLITLPPGASLAEPSRRLLATAIDLIPGLLLASTIWSDAESPTNFADVGILPLAVVAGVTVLHTTLAESIFGRTLGKAVLGCRTVTLDGHKPRWSQALGRNLTKVLCPALVVFVIANPFVSHPGAMGTVVIIDPHDPDADPRDADPDPPHSGSDDR